MDDDAKKILSEAHETLRAAARVQSEARPRPESYMHELRRHEPAAPTAPREVETARQRRAIADESWNTWCDQRIATALDDCAFNQKQSEVFIELISQLRREWREEIAKLRTELQDKSKVIDLPSLPTRGRSRDTA